MPGDADILNTQNELATRRAHLAHLIQQQLRLGPYTPPHVLMDMQDDRRQIAQLKARLRAWGQPADDAPGDVEEAQPARPAAGPDASGVSVGDITITLSGDLRGSNAALLNSVGGDMVSSAQHSATAAPTALDTLRQLRGALAAARGLPAPEADDLTDANEAAIRALERAAPNPARAADRLGAMLETLGRLAAHPEAGPLAALVAQARRQLDGAA